MARKQTSAKKVVQKTKGGARRKRAPMKSANLKAPYEWSSKGGAKRDPEKKADDSDVSTTDSEDDDEEDDGVEEVKVDDEVMEVSNGLVCPTHKTKPSPTKSGSVQKKMTAKDTVGSLQEYIGELKSRNVMLSRQVKSVTKMGGVDRYEVMQLRKMVKEDLFKKVKFITTSAMEKKCLEYLANKNNVSPETQRDWCATYAHCIRNALNNKRNNVPQDLKVEIKGKWKTNEDVHIQESRNANTSLFPNQQPF